MLERRWNGLENVDKSESGSRESSGGDDDAVMAAQDEDDPSLPRAQLL